EAGSIPRPPRRPRPESVLPPAGSDPRALAQQPCGCAHLRHPDGDGAPWLGADLYGVRPHAPPDRALPMKAPPVTISCRDLTLRFPVYGVDAKSLKKQLAKITVGGRLGRSIGGATEVTALSKLD